MNSKALHMVTFLLLIIGGLNWGLVGLADINLVMMIFGNGRIADVIYILVGLSAIIELLAHKKKCADCR